MCKRVKTEASRPLLTCQWLRLVNSPSCLLHGQPPRGRMRSVLGNLPEHTLTTGRCGGPRGAGGQGTTPLATSVLWFRSRRRDQGSPLPPAARAPRRTLAGTPLLLTRTRGPRARLALRDAALPFPAAVRSPGVPGLPQWPALSLGSTKLPLPEGGCSWEGRLPP